MKKIISIVLSCIFLVGCSSTEENLKEKSNLVNSIESKNEIIQIDSNWNIPVKGEISGEFCGFIDNHSFELLGEDGKYYAVSILKAKNEDVSYLENENNKITIEYVIEEEGTQLTLLKIIDKN